MERLVVVSNRLPKAGSEASAGGLAVALRAALEQTRGLWIGWSGRAVACPGVRSARPEPGRYRSVALDLSDAEVDGYYDRLSNRALWPVLHGRLGYARFSRAAYETYRHVSRRFADVVARLVEPGDAIWVHDYHLIPLGGELRRLGVTTPIGFFLHVPFPAPEAFAALPWWEELAADLSAYDLVGFQTPDCVENFRNLMERSPASATRDGVAAAAFPIGIDTCEFAKLAASPPVVAETARLESALGGRIGIVGVERLDYTKGLAERFCAFEQLLEQAPAYRDRVTFCQIAAPSRLSIPEYKATRTELESLAGRINGRFASFDWTPLRHLIRTFTQDRLAALYRASRVGLVTPLRDGMNLVAKEYIAAQNPADPGVLVLSQFAGAAHELRDALIVNPHDTAAMVGALRTALDMPRDERRRRWARMMRHLQVHDVHRWRRRFLAALDDAAKVGGVKVAA